MEKILTPEYILAFIAIIISIFSLIFTVCQSRKTFRITEEHNRKSVEPLLSHHYIALQNSDVPNCGVESLILTNCGFGPACIKSFQLIWNNKTFTNMSDLYIEFIKDPQYMAEISTASILSNAVIASKESLPVFKFYFTKKVPFQVDYFHAINFRKLAKEVSLKIEFVTIYEENRFLEIKSIYD